MSVTDIKARLVDCNIAIGLAIIGVIYNFTISPSSGLYSIIGAIIAAVVIEIIARLGIKPLGSRIMGEGDTYVAGAIGACFGMYSLWPLLICTIIASMLYALPLYIKKQFKLGNIDICVLLCVFVAAAILYRYFQNIVIFSIIAFTGTYLAVRIFKSIKNNEKDQTIIPFVPAFAAAAVFYLLFY